MTCLNRVVLCLLVLFRSPLASGQFTSHLQGTIYDTTGGVIPGVSKSLDTNSNAERINEYDNGNAPAVAYSGQVVNTWSPNQLYDPSDYDLKHQINANWMYDVPVGHEMRWGKNLDQTLNALFGGWELSGLVRWISGYPFSVSTYEFPTNFELDNRSILVGPAPKTGTYFDSQGNPNVFAAGSDAANAFRYAYPGESGQRNNRRKPGYFGVDTSVAKSWRMVKKRIVRFTWDVFNATNSVRFDVETVSNYLYYQPSLGKAHPDAHSAESDVVRLALYVPRAFYHANESTVRLHLHYNYAKEPYDCRRDTHAFILLGLEMPSGR